MIVGQPRQLILVGSREDGPSARQNMASRLKGGNACVSCKELVEVDSPPQTHLLLLPVDYEKVAGTRQAGAPCRSVEVQGQHSWFQQLQPSASA